MRFEKPFLESNLLPLKLSWVSSCLLIALCQVLQRSYLVYGTSKLRTTFSVRDLYLALLRLALTALLASNAFEVFQLPFFLLAHDVLFLLFAPFLVALFPLEPRVRAVLFLSLPPSPSALVLFANSELILQLLLLTFVDL